MRAVVIYESMYGNTRQIAEAIAEGFGDNATTCAVAFVTDDDLAADFLVVGGPTHAHGMSRASTRKSAEDRIRLGQAEGHMDDHADLTTGVREWLESVDLTGRTAAAFDTRMHAPSIFTGRASKGIARRLRRAGATVIGEPTSFFVTKHAELADGELDRARAFGASLGARLSLRSAA
ncbi:MAG TPA: flavodoxin domain-containing protein [Acidimicrobiales bacterium]|nr:flavodoxin domain-containing protein [Acidimicrobiales bacterium]